MARTNDAKPAAAAAHRAVARDEGWRPIKTAPKDGTKVLLKFSGPFSSDTLEDGIVTGRFYSPGWWLSSIWASTAARREPTHWAPLPSFGGESE